MAGEGLPVQVACRVLNVSESGYYEWRSRPRSEREVRHAWLTDLIRQIHTTSRGTYGSRRAHAELPLGQNVPVSHGSVELLMRRARIVGIGGRRKWKYTPPDTISADLVKREFARPRPNQLWVTDITEHRTREGKVYCAAVLDTYSRRIVGWSIDSSPSAALVTNALGMAIDSRRGAGLEAGTVIHIDHLNSPSSRPGPSPSGPRTPASCPRWGRLAPATTNSMIESFWSRMQVELVDRQRWTTRIELANAMFDYIDIWHNRQRRHSSLGMLTPIQFEVQTPITVA